MRTTNYLEQAMLFLTRNSHRLALRVAPIALVAVAVAHATPSFNAPSSTRFDTDDENCNHGGALSGAVTHGGLGVTLSGNATLTGYGEASPCFIGMIWQGTGSGAFSGTTATIGSNLTITAPSDVVINSWTLTVYIDGSQVTTYGCTTSCSGTFPTLPHSFTVPTTLSTWEVDLYVNASWTDTGETTLTVSVPSSSSIDLLASGAPAPTVPALTPLALIMTAILLLGLVGFGILRRTSTGGGFPGPPS